MESIEDRIRGFVCQELKLAADTVTDTANLRELPGMESIKVLRIVAKIERAYGVELADDLVFNVETVRDLAAAVRELAGTEDAAAARSGAAHGDAGRR